jgi:8-oxo-dGTP pyrophosphatase MutT (NUDIX family)
VAELESTRFERFTRRLEERLARPLPGLAAQLTMAPRPRHASDHFDPARAVPAAVVTLLYPMPRDEPTLVLTRRTEHVAAHKGQICLPGGALDAGESARDAALRELEEEVGVERSAVRVVGTLTPVLISVSGFRVEPFVAVAPRRPRFAIAAHEVDELIEMPLASLGDRSIRGERRAMRDGREVVVPYFEIQGRHVWGATAMVLAEFAAVVAEVAA